MLREDPFETYARRKPAITPITNMIATALTATVAT
jgi:hypothetical protein